jgi:hypothetical protein
MELECNKIMIKSGSFIEQLKASRIATVELAVQSLTPIPLRPCWLVIIQENLPSYADPKC